MTAASFPDAEKNPSTVTEPPLSLSLSAPTALRIDNDNQLLYHLVGETFTVIDLATFAIAGASNTPFPLSSDTDLSGSLKGVAFSPNGNKLFVTQDGGKLLTYTLSDLTAKPTQSTVASGKELTFVEFDTNAMEVLIFNKTDSSILRFNSSSASVAATVPLVASGSVNVDSMHFVPSVVSGSGRLYLTDDSGKLYVLSSGGTSVTTVTLDSAGTDDLKGIAATPNSVKLYVVNATDKLVHVLSTSSNSVTTTIDLSENSDLDQIAAADVTDPSGTYAFVGGSLGLSIFDAADNDVFDLGSTSDDDEPLAVSGIGEVVASNDGYVYVVYGDIAVITDNPWVTVTATRYSSGRSSLGVGEAVTLDFEADETGTYETRIGGDTTGSGTLLKDSSANTSGTVASANSAQSITFNYDDNSTLWAEGDNTVFLFVTDSDGNKGRRATTVTVDTPPPLVTITGTGFGDGKVFVNITRLSQADIQTYRVYADTDSSAVATKSTIAASAVQPTSGDVTVTVTGLTNGNTIFIAAEAVDTAGNISASRTTTLANGTTTATGLPEQTVGPAVFSGETGCTLIMSRRLGCHPEGTW